MKWLIFKFIVLLTGIFLILSTGCADDLLGDGDATKKEDLGAEVKPETINAEIDKVLQQNKIQDLSVGDNVLYEWNFRADSGPVRLLSILQSEIIDRTETESNIRLVQWEKVTDYEDGKIINEVETETPIVIDKSDQNGTVAARTLKMLKAPVVHTLTEDSKVIKVSYHRLKVKEVIVDPPRRVRESENCGGIPGCQLKATEIKYDEVLWTSKTERRIVNHTLTLTADIHALANIVNKCSSGYQRIEERDYFLTFCTVLRDF